MIITAIIAEYNPFHNGHQYQLEEARRLTGADFVLVLMSGNFVQRGTPAITDKYTRTKMALCGRADLVLELPVRYACGSAEFFAGGAVALLNALGCVDYLCFGCENDSLVQLQAVADVLAEEPESYRISLQNTLKEGASFPAARETAISEYFEYSCDSRETIKDCDNDDVSTFLHELLSQPNNILALEYLKALKKTGSAIKPFPIKRKGSGYHDESLDNEFASATAIRKEFRGLYLEPAEPSSDTSQITETVKSTDGSASSTPSAVPKMTDHSEAAKAFDFDFTAALSSVMSTTSVEILNEAYGKSFPVFPEDFSSMTALSLLRATDWSDYCQYFDVSESLARRIYASRYEFSDLEKFVSAIKTRNLTEGYVRRGLLHILLELSAPSSARGDLEFTTNRSVQRNPEYEVPCLEQEKFAVYYFRVLGFRESATALLHEIKEKGRLPLLTKTANARKIFSSFDSFTQRDIENAMRLFQEDLHAAAIFNAAVSTHFRSALKNEFLHEIIKL